MKYKVYEHYFKSSGKSYIGYTSLSIECRLHKHFTNAISGIDSKFYRAIRKYGIQDIESKVLFESNSTKKIKEKEKEFIKIKDTFKNGYNMTLGGDGGNCLLNMTTTEKRTHIEKLKMRSTGSNNSNHSGLTDEQIINKAVEFFILHGKLVRRHWMKYCKEISYPMNYSKCRFSGNGYYGFISSLKNKLKEMNIKFKEEDFLLSKQERYSKEIIDSNRKISDEEIIDKAIEFYLIDDMFVPSRWTKFCVENNLPLNFAKSKFGGGRFKGLGTKGFYLALEEKLLELNIEFKIVKIYNQYGKK